MIFVKKRSVENFTRDFVRVADPCGKKTFFAKFTTFHPKNAIQRFCPRSGPFTVKKLAYNILVREADPL